MRLSRRIREAVNALRARQGREARLDAIRQSFGLERVNAGAIDRVAMSPTLKLLANRTQKNANSTLVSAIHFIETGKVHTSIRARERVASLARVPVAQVPELVGWRRVLVVRDPYARVLSAFLDKMSAANNQRRYGRYDLTPEGFRAFLGWLETGGLSRNGHWDLQTKQMFFPFEAHTDVLRMEELGETLPALFLELGADVAAMQERGVLQKSRRHRTDAGEKLRRFYDEETVGIVARLFRSDFDTLGYDPDRTPLTPHGTAGG